MNSLIKKFIWGILVSGSVGCATYHARPLVPSETASSFEARTLENKELKTYIDTSLGRQIEPWPPESWDLRLLTLTSFFYHPDLDVARARWGTAEAAFITAGARPNPSLQFPLEFSANPPGGASPWTIGSILNIPIETAGKRGYRMAQARNLSTAARLQIANVAWQVRSRLRASLLELYAALQSRKILEEQLRFQEEVVRLLEKRLQVGDIAVPVLTEAHLSLNQTRLSLQDAFRLTAENRVRVAGAIGLTVQALQGINLSFSAFEELPGTLPPPQVRQAALLCRSDILSALSEYEAAQSALQLEVARQYPNIQIGPGYRFEEDENKWAFGFLVVLPVLNQNQGPIAEAEARRRAAAARFLVLQSGIIGEIDRTLTGYAESLAKAKTAEDILQEQKRQEASVRAGFDLGENDRLALLNAQFAVSAARLARLRAFYAAQQSLGALEDAVQHPLGPSGWIPPLPEAVLNAGEESRQWPPRR